MAQCLSNLLWTPQRPANPNSATYCSLFLLFSPFLHFHHKPTYYLIYSLSSSFYPFLHFPHRATYHLIFASGKTKKNYKTAHDRCLREIFRKKKMLSPLAPRSRNECLSLILLLLSLFSAFLSHADAHSWIEAVTYVRDNTPVGKIGYARGNGPQFPSPPYINTLGWHFTEENYSQFFAPSRVSTRG